MGRYMAAELLDSDFFEGVDVIIPIPLHKKKQQFRDYNQSECIAPVSYTHLTLPTNREV